MIEYNRASSSQLNQPVAVRGFAGKGGHPPAQLLEKFEKMQVEGDGPSTASNEPPNDVSSSDKNSDLGQVEPSHSGLFDNTSMGGPTDVGQMDVDGTGEQVVPPPSIEDDNVGCSVGDGEDFSSSMDIDSVDVEQDVGKGTEEKVVEENDEDVGRVKTSKGKGKAREGGQEEEVEASRGGKGQPRDGAQEEEVEASTGGKGQPRDGVQVEEVEVRTGGKGQALGGVEVEEVQASVGKGKGRAAEDQDDKESVKSDDEKDLTNDDEDEKGDQGDDEDEGEGEGDQTDDDDALDDNVKGKGEGDADAEEQPQLKCGKGGKKKVSTGGVRKSKRTAGLKDKAKPTPSPDPLEPKKKTSVVKKPTTVLKGKTLPGASGPDRSVFHFLQGDVSAWPYCQWAEN
jgi:hypothetical protein